MSAKTIVEDIIADLDDRRGLGHEWRLVDEDIQQGIREAWEAIVSEGLPRWIPVSERLPEHMSDVLVLTRHFANFGRPWMAVAFCHTGSKWCADGFDMDLEVTHWMPLPEGP